MNYFVVCLKPNKQPIIVERFTSYLTPDKIACPRCKKKVRVKGLLQNTISERSHGHYVVYRKSINGQLLQDFFHALTVLADAKPLNLNGAENIVKVLETK